MLTKEQKAIAINLAMSIDSGEISLKTVLDELETSNEKAGWEHIIAFWLKCNDMTKSVVDRLYLEKLYRLPTSEK